MFTYEKRKPRIGWPVISIAIIVILALGTFLMVQAATPGDFADIEELATYYTETHDSDLLADNAELHIAGSNTTICGCEEIEIMLGKLYTSHGTVLGVDVQVTDVMTLSDNWVMVEYTYSGTAFYGDVYPMELMLDHSDISVPMISLYQIENSAIMQEVLLDGSTPLAVELNMAGF